MNAEDTSRSTTDITEKDGTPIASSETASFKHPHNWPRWQKWLFTLVVSYCDFLTILVSMMLAPGVPQVLETFRPDGRDKFLGSFCVTVYILGFCIGPLVLAPLTDLYGRAFILRLSIACFTAMTIGCALATSLEMLIAFRFIAGMFGGAPMAIGGAVVADLYPIGRRGRPMACYAFGTMMGPTIGPVLGGIVNGRLNWRWIFWVASMFAGTCAFGIFFVLRETHVPTLLNRHRSQVTDASPRSKLLRFFPEKRAESPSIFAVLKKAVEIPTLLTVRHPTIAAILLLMLVFNGIINIVLSSLGSVYQTNYGWSRTIAGLPYLGIGLGGLTALATAKRLSDLLGRKLRDRDTTKHPEHNLPLVILSLPLTTIGLIWYGWAAQEHAHWFVPIPGLFLFGFAFMGVRLSTQIFLIDAIPTYSASALAVHTIGSSIGGAFIPLGTFPMYGSVGYGWGNTIVGFVDLLMAGIPLILFFRARRSSTHLRIELAN